MAKFVSSQHITAEKGVTKFQTFCANHNPFLIFREESKHDYGIDGEVEITKKTNVGKIEATGDILKVQLKSTKLKGYIGFEDNNSFEFIAKTQDIEYWKSHPIPVILVVYFEVEDLLFAKKIEKEFIVKNSGSHKIIFDKQKNILTNISNFENVLNQTFVPRIDYDVTETLYINIHKLKLPNSINKYESKLSNMKDVTKIIRDNELYPTPKFVLSSKDLYCFQNLNSYNSIFKNNVLKNDTCSSIYLKNFITKGNPERNVIVWIVKQYLSDFFRKKGILYNKDFDRYYFGKFKTEPLEIDKRKNSTTEFYRFEISKSKTGRKDKRSVVAKYIYYETSFFYRHLGFQLFFEWIENELYLIFEPKYLFTEDGKTPLSNRERITRLTNQLKQTERNNQYLNHLFFLRNFLDFGELCIFFEDEKTKIEVNSALKIKVDFGIKEDATSEKIKEENNNQISLF